MSVCIFHGKREDEHLCLVCCLCYRDLVPEDCNVLEDGSLEDVCKECAEREKHEMERRGLK